MNTQYEMGNTAGRSNRQREYMETARVLSRVCDSFKRVHSFTLETELFTCEFG